MATKKKITAKVASMPEVAPVKAAKTVEERKKKAAPRKRAAVTTKKTAAVKVKVEAAAPVMSAEEIHAEITRVAHGYWVERNYAPGDPMADWLRAEAEVRTRFVR